MKSIRSRLFLMLLLLIILPYFISVISIYANSRSNQERQELEKSREALVDSSKDVTNHLERYIQFPYSLYNSPNIFPLYETGTTAISEEAFSLFQKTMETVSVTQPELGQIRFYFHQDQTSITVYNASFSAPKEQPEFLQQPLFYSLYEGENSFFIEKPKVMENYDNTAIVPSSGNKLVLPMHYKVADVLTGTFLGFLTIDLDIQSFVPYIQDLATNENDIIYLLNEKKEIVYSNEQNEIGSRFQPNRFTANQVVLSQKLVDPLPEWELVKIVSKTDLVEEANEAASVNVLLGSGVVLMGIIMIIIVSNIVTKPISQLSEQVQLIKSGVGTISIDKNRKDEIWYLATNIQEMLNRIQAHVNREYKLELEIRRSELRLLRSQVNPHFLFNALQTIGAVALRSNNYDVYKLVVSLSNMMRYSLQADQFVRVKEEMDYIESYVSLQKERFGDDVRVVIAIDRGMEQQTIPSMIIQPLVENFFKHSFEEAHELSTLSITGRIVENKMEFDVVNDGLPVSEKRIAEIRQAIKSEGAATIGVGLKNIHDRILMHYGEGASMHIHSPNKGFAIRITIPLTIQQSL